MTLVVGYDGCDGARAALDYAARHAEGGQVFIVSAADPVPDYLGKPYRDHFIAAAHSRTRSLLEEAAGLMPEGVEYVTELLEGAPAEGIVSVADARDADAIVIGSRGLSRMRALLGSVSHEVLHLAGRPVIVVPTGKGD